MADKKVQIIIDALDKTKAAFQSAGNGLKSFSEDIKGKFKSIQENWLGVTAAIAGTTIAAKKIWDSAQLASEFEQSRQAFNGMVQKMGRDAETEFQKIKRSSANLIDDKTIVEATNRAMSLGIPIERVAELMEIARAKARDMGITTTQAFNDIVTGIGRGSPLILDNLGLTLKIGEANAKYAASLHKTVEQLTEQEKKQAILNATVDAGKEALSRHDLTIKTSAETMQEFSVNIANLEKNFGQLSGSILNKVIPAINELFSLMNDFSFGDNVDIIKNIETWSKEVEEQKRRLKLSEKSSFNWQAYGTPEEIRAKIKALNEVIVQESEKLGIGTKSQKSAAVDIPTTATGDENWLKTKSAEIDAWMAKEEQKIEISKKAADELVELQKTVVDKIKEKNQELIDFEKTYRDYMIESQNMILEVQNQGKDKETSAYTDYYETVLDLQNKQREADQLQGEDKIKLLNEVQKGWQNISKEVTDNDQQIISAQTAQNAALTAMMQIEKDITNEYAKGAGALGKQRDTLYEVQSKAEEVLRNISGGIQNLNNQQVKLNLDTTDAERKIREIQQQINNLNYSAAIKNIDAELAKAAKYDRSEFAIELSLGKP